MNFSIRNFFLTNINQPSQSEIQLIVPLQSIGTGTYLCHLLLYLYGLLPFLIRIIMLGKNPVSVNFPSANSLLRD